ncbi:MAG: prepilin-type N-terminal cleavage/methylation domain-containing protein [Gammaproteobacteria bacterium]
MPRPLPGRAFTLLEILIALAVVSVAMSVAVPAYTQYVDRAKISQAIGDIAATQQSIQRYFTETFRYPDTLADAGIVNFNDPWGNPYQYLNLADAEKKTPKGVRKDKNLHPLNTDYDLYSMGKDGKSVSPLTAKASHDDVIRASDGSFIDLASKY